MAIAAALRVAVQITILPIIGRILGPHVYGQVALVSPFIFFSMLLAESGLGACIVRAETVTPALEGTIFTFSATLSLFFIAAFAVIAYPLGHFMNEPAFPALLMGMSTILLLAAFTIVPSALLLRAKKYQWMAMSDVASSIGSLIAVTFGILMEWGVWSLVAQQIALWVCKVAVITIGARVRPKLIFRREILKTNIQYGSNLTGSAILTFIARNIDNVLIGRFMGAVVLGYYALAFQIAAIPQMVLAGSVYFTIFSSTSEAVRDGTSPAPRFLSALRGVALICAPAIAGMAATASLSVPLILGDKWGPTSRLIVLLTPLGLAQTLSAPMSGVINGLGRADALFRIVLVSSTATVVAIFACVWISSDAVALGVGLTSLSFPLLALRVIMKECAVTFRQILHAIGGPLFASLLMAIGVAVLVGHLPEQLPLIVSLIIAVAAGAGLYVLILLVFFRDQIGQDWQQVKATLRRGGSKDAEPTEIQPQKQPVADAQTTL